MMGGRQAIRASFSICSTIDRQRKLLMLQELADLGAKDGMLLDGGSRSMAIGKGRYRGLGGGFILRPSKK